MQEKNNAIIPRGCGSMFTTPVMGMRIPGSVSAGRCESKPSTEPVFHGQKGYARKISRVTGNQDHVIGQGRGGDLFVGKGEFLNFIGIVFLAGVTIVCYLRIIPILLRKKDTMYAVLAIIEVLVLTLAASGVLKSGGH